MPSDATPNIEDTTTGLRGSPSPGDARQRVRELIHLNAFISVTNEDGDGTVVAVKDLIDVRGVVTTAGGRILPAEPAAQDAAVVRNLRRHRCVVVGKTNLHPWGYGATSENADYGDVRNPHDSTRVAGGSSGGSAVAVATGMSAWAIGTDTGGSIRIPASLCGVVGFKPTFGALSTEGVLPLAPSLDTVGPLAPDVASAAQAFEAMSGRSPAVDAVGVDWRELALAVPAGWVEGLDAETGDAWKSVASALPEIVFPERVPPARAALTVLHAEAAAVHREWIDAYGERYPPDVLEKLRQGLSITKGEYRDALEACRRFREEVEEAMSGWDAVLLPATACIAPRLGRTANVTEPLTRFTRPFNASGQPVVVIPVPGCRPPVGIQIVGHVDQDAALLRVAAAVERAWNSGSHALRRC
jgi:aspartyl-tRNA(Asn)/glutamyl-tRNA(Gln) amidotransferase subunit A